MKLALEFGLVFETHVIKIKNHTLKRLSMNGLDGVFLVANAQLSDFPIIYVSDKFTAKMGYTRADLIGQPITLDFMDNKDSFRSETVK